MNIAQNFSSPRFSESSKTVICPRHKAPISFWTTMKLLKQCSLALIRVTPFFMTPARASGEVAVSNSSLDKLICLDTCHPGSSAVSFSCHLAAAPVKIFGSGWPEPQIWFPMFPCCCEKRNQDRGQREEDPGEAGPEQRDPGPATFKCGAQILSLLQIH